MKEPSSFMPAKGEGANQKSDENKQNIQGDKAFNPTRSILKIEFMQLGKVKGVGIGTVSESHPVSAFSREDSIGISFKSLINFDLSFQILLINGTENL